MIRQLLIVLSLALVMVLSSACTSTETNSRQTIGSSSASNAAAIRHEAGRDKVKEAAETYVQLGLGYLREGERQRARFNLLKALEKDERSGAAHNGLALLFQMEGEKTLAEQHFKKAIAIQPDLTSVRYNYGLFLLRDKRYEDAEKQFLTASEDINYPRRSQVFLSLGLIAKQLSKPEAAQAAWKKALRLSPKLAPAYLELAEINFKSGNYPNAKRYLDRYEELSRPSSRGLWLAVRLEHAFGNKDAEASKALALRNLFPYSKETLEYKTWLKMRKKGVSSLFSGAKDTLQYKDLMSAQ
ncbi:type IV pilus biogenesis/stability protein PilW [Gammaproteobacteria bacterium 53_120_T64]|nr:type IV pilus biogenesis/stability protein PilW [Gammaproteobacteria bacterium 53_120_T64]